MSGSVNLTVLKPVQSSNIEAIGYDLDAHAFLVRWKGRVTPTISVYADVPADVAEKVLTAPSAGKAVRAILVPSYKHQYLPAAA